MLQFLIQASSASLLHSLRVINSPHEPNDEEEKKLINHLELFGNSLKQNGGFSKSTKITDGDDDDAGKIMFWRGLRAEPRGAASKHRVQHS